MKIFVNESKIEQQVVDYLVDKYNGDFSIIEKYKKSSPAEGIYYLFVCKDSRFQEHFFVKYFLNPSTVDIQEDDFNLSDYAQADEEGCIFDDYSNILIGWEYAEKIQSKLSDDVFVYCDMNFDSEEFYYTFNYSQSDDWKEYASPNIYVYYQMGTDSEQLIDIVKQIAEQESFYMQDISICGLEDLSREEIIGLKNEKLDTYDYFLSREYENLKVLDYFYIVNEPNFTVNVQRIKG